MTSSNFYQNKNQTDLYDSILKNNKPSKLEIKLENMREVIHKTTQNLYINHWKNHIPVYGWTKMNYPNSIKPSLVRKYESQQKQFQELLNEQKLKFEKEKEELQQLPKKQGKKQYRINPEIVNLEVYNENVLLVDAENNPSEKFLIKKNDNLLYYRNIFKKIEEKKANFLSDNNIPYNYNKQEGTMVKKLVNELGYKNSIAVLSTNTHLKKQEWMEAKFSYETKYCTIFPKRILVGDKPTNDFSKPMKKIGDISFEEEVYEPENVKNLKRWTADNLNNESLKDFLSEEVKILNIENHYWISQDVLSKLGRLAGNLIELNLRNLDIINESLDMILSHSLK